MLVEKTNVRQIPSEGFRRWFTDRYFDLIVWYEHEEIVGFRLCYDKAERERALTWRKRAGFTHDRIDDGETPGSAKMSPVLEADGTFDRAAIAQRFCAASRQIDGPVADFVHIKITEYTA